MSSLCDRTGFPVVPVPALGLRVQLLPVTKVQFERFLAEPGGFGDSWYQQVLAVHPRISYTKLTEANREGLFLTAIFPEEALGFARWLGAGWELPAAATWRRILAEFARMQWKPFQTRLAGEPLSHGARCILRELLRQVRPQTVLDLSLMSNGLMEWVQVKNEWKGLGQPRPIFFQNAFNCWIDEPVSPIPKDGRSRIYGLRLIQKESASSQTGVARQDPDEFMFP